MPHRGPIYIIGGGEIYNLDFFSDKIELRASINDEADAFFPEINLAIGKYL
jgi:hypothetical protein